MFKYATTASLLLIIMSITMTFAQGSTMMEGTATATATSVQSQNFGKPSRDIFGVTKTTQERRHLYHTVCLARPMPWMGHSIGQEWGSHLGSFLSEYLPIYTCMHSTIQTYTSLHAYVTRHGLLPFCWLLFFFIFHIMSIRIPNFIFL